MKKNIFDFGKKHNHSHGGMKSQIMLPYAYSHIMAAQSRILFLSEDITNESAHELCSMLLWLDTQSHDTITLNLSTNGGSASAMVQILDTFQIIGSPVRVVNLGRCYSAGAIILANGAPGQRFCLENSEVMVHSLQTIFPFPGEDTSNSKDYYKFLDNYNNNILRLLSRRTKKTFEQVKEDLKEDLYLSAKDALSYGIIDHIV